MFLARYYAAIKKTDFQRHINNKVEEKLKLKNK